MFTYVVYKKNYINFNRILHSPTVNTVYNQHYLARKSLFEILPKTKGEIIFIGSSKTEYCEWAELLENTKIKNRGIGSDQIDGIIMRIDQVIRSNPEKVFIMIGANDLRAKKTIPEIVQKYAQLINIIKSESPETLIYLQSVLPINYNKLRSKNIAANLNTQTKILNNELRSLCQTLNLQYIDYWPLLAKNNELISRYTTDGIHLTGDAYLLIKSIIKKHVM